jgi:phage internal scaffolding protein
MFYRKHNRVTLDCGTEQITKQSHKAECDIHNILKQYQRTGIITHVQNARPTYTDLPSDMDYQNALNTMIAAEAAFNDLPARVRAKWDNDPAAFLAAFSDPQQEATLREYGLLKPAEGPQANSATQTAPTAQNAPTGS